MEHRGALIVLEGCDRSGKTTQCKMLVDSLIASGISAKLLKFPERSTVIGKMINEYLSQSKDLEDHVIHLLFSANRWEHVPEMMRLLNGGTTLIVDRYAFSGVAFTAAKKNFDLEWCKQPDVGLPRPDKVLYLTLTPDAAAKRGGYGDERYEKQEFQKAVAGNYDRLEDGIWERVEADRSVNDLHKELLDLAMKTINNVKTTNIRKLWTD